MFFLLIVSSLSLNVFADIHSNTTAGTPDAHAPIGVMGDHTHHAGEWMFSYRFMQMRMKDNVQGSNSISPEQIISLPNAFAPPANLRVVPLEMTTDMHMFGLMYAPNDNVTLMAMANYLDKSMEHLTYMGMMGGTVRGKFTTESSGFGDTKLAALVKWKSDDTHNVHLNIGLSIPTGGISEKDQILPPMGALVEKILPYAMQLGSGTWDIEPGITYAGNASKWGWGAQYIATLRLEDNSKNYSLGDQHRINSWGSYRLKPWLSTSLRLSYTDLDNIDGADQRVALPVQTADPHNYGGERVDLALGFNLLGQNGTLRGHRLALEYEQPITQHVNGVQLEMRDMFTLGYQYAF
jgi:hypothetical protein